MKEKFINSILDTIIENAREVKEVYNDLQCVHKMDALYKECALEISTLETLCQIIGKMINASEIEYDTLNNAFRFTYNTSYGKKEDFVTLEAKQLESYLRIKL